jgi:hypothetical protein
MISKFDPRVGTSFRAVAETRGFSGYMILKARTDSTMPPRMLLLWIKALPDKIVLEVEWMLASELASSLPGANRD